MNTTSVDRELAAVLITLPTCMTCRHDYRTDRVGGEE